MRGQVRFFIFLLFLILFLSQQTSSQTHIHSQKQELIFEHYTTDQGLSASIVRCMIQDKIGYLWFGTYSGLDRYDGISFKSYKNIPGDTLSITNAFVQCLLEDKKGNLWIGTTNGLDKLDRGTEKFIHYKPFNDTAANEWNNNVFSICEDQFGYLWIGTGDGLNRFDPSSGQFTYFRNDNSNRNSLKNNVINVLMEDKSGTLWIGTGNGLDKYDRDTESFIHFWQDSIYREGFYDGGVRNKYRINAIYEDVDGTLWIGTQDGLLELNSDRDTFTLYKYDLDNSESISHYATTSICKENDNSVWIGTWNGLNLFDKSTKKFTRIYYNNKVLTSLSHNSIAAVLRERSGTFWVSTYGGGVNKVNRTSYPFKQYSEQNWRETKRFSSASIMNMSNSRDGSIWLATPTGLLNFHPDTEIFHNYKITHNIRLVKEDRSGNLWIGVNNSSGRGLIKLERSGRIINITDSSGNKFPWLVNQIIEDNDSTLWACTGDEGGIIKINTRTNKYLIVYRSSTTINTIYKDQNDIIFIGTRENGLLSFDLSINKVTNHFLSDPNNPASISGNTVITIFEDEHGILWLGTNMGLNKFDRDANTFMHYTELNGLPHNWVYLIFEDAKKNLWLSTHKGMTKFNPFTKTFSNYDILQGLIAADRAGVGCQSENGEIYLDSPGGLTRFHPDSIKDNPYIPAIVITSIKIADKSVLFTDNIKLPFGSDHLNFEFAALSYVRPEKNLFAYKMENIDKEWIYAGTRHNSTYTNLKPGDYIFRVKGSNNDGIWNEEGASIKIIILPPWWQTNLAYSIYFLFIASAIYFTWKAQLRRQQIKHEYEMSKFEAQKLHEVDELKSRFFTNISHEFRTPLTLILGPVKQMIEWTKDEKFRDNLNMVHRNAHRLLELVNQLLDISKLESGSIKLQTVPQNIVPLLKALVLSFASYAERKKIALTMKAEDEVIDVYLDKDKFEKIINNILANAFKFTPPGGKIEVTVTPSFSSKSDYSHSVPFEAGSESTGEVKKLKQACLAVRQVQFKNYIQIIIADTGIGIPKQKLSKIFDRFYQVDSSHTREQEGTGIGLALTKELIDLHKGKIEVESEEGRGTTVIIEIPLGKDHLNSEEIIEQSERQETDQAKIKEHIFEFEESKTETKIDIESLKKESLPLLLIIEDNSDVRKYIKDNLNPEFRIIEAKDGEDGWNKSLEYTPDLIVSDVMMPKMDGFKFCEKLKTDERTSHIPVILLTAKAAKQDKLDGYELGADDYIMKPFDTDELKVRVKNLIQQRERIHQHFKQHGLIELNLAKITPTDRKFLQTFYELIIKNISDPDFGIDQLVEKVNISRSVLHRKIISLIGEAPGELIRRTRINKAAELIEHKFGNLSEIALEVGFSNPAYFSEVFKKQFGVTPSQYQRKFSNS